MIILGKKYSKKSFFDFPIIFQFFDLFVVHNDFFSGNILKKFLLTFFY